MRPFRAFIREFETKLEYHDALNPRLWTGDRLRAEVRQKLLQVAQAWVGYARVPPQLVRDVVITGGNVNFNYTPSSDIDLHVIEPTGQEAFYGYNRTLAGGLVSRDFTQGYGPEEYLIHRAVPGVYKIAANYFGTSQQSLQGPVTVQATVITNFGRPTERRQSLTLRLTNQKETVPIGEITFGK